jgi:heme o synthase
MQATEGWQKTGEVEELLVPPRLTWRKLIVTLFKLRVVSLLVLASLGGAALGTWAGGDVSPAVLGLLLLTGTLSAAGASAINQYLERERDTRMSRTAARPLATGQIESPLAVLWLALGMIASSLGLALAFGNPALAFWLFMGAFIYVVVYTIWLKPRTTANIVIGGAAGSCAVIAGGAAVGMWLDLSVWLLATLVFVWTPVHFWALALAYREDYVKADYPMLPAKVSAEKAAWWTAAHTVLTAVFALAIGFVPQLDPIYLLLIGVATIPLFTRTKTLLDTPVRKPALALFTYTNIYLALVLVVVMMAGLWR